MRQNEARVRAALATLWQNFGEVVAREANRDGGRKISIESVRRIGRKIAKGRADGCDGQGRFRLDVGALVGVPVRYERGRFTFVEGVQSVSGSERWGRRVLAERERSREHGDSLARAVGKYLDGGDRDDLEAALTKYLADENPFSAGHGRGVESLRADADGGGS